jgi:hypothetical protein
MVPEGLSGVPEGLVGSPISALRKRLEKAKEGAVCVLGKRRKEENIESITLALSGPHWGFKRAPLKPLGGLTSALRGHQ